MSKIIKAVFIDVDNTLIDFSECARNATVEICHRQNIEYSPEIYEMFTRVNNELWSRIERGTLEKAELYRIRWKTIFENLGIETDYSNAESDFRKYIAENPVPVEGAVDLLCYLSEKYPIIVTSNASLAQQEKRLRATGMLKYLTAVATSEAAGAAKPEKKFFDYCMSFAPDVDKSEIMIIGDSLKADIVGGKNYGLATCWFNYLGENPPKDCAADYTARSLSEIKNIL